MNTTTARKPVDLPLESVHRLQCALCGHTWLPRTARPMQCPNCHRMNWAVKRTIKKK